jgi:hypothetical protein
MAKQTETPTETEGGTPAVNPLDTLGTVAPADVNLSRTGPKHDERLQPLYDAIVNAGNEGVLATIAVSEEDAPQYGDLVRRAARSIPGKPLEVRTAYNPRTGVLTFGLKSLFPTKKKA